AAAALPLWRELSLAEESRRNCARALAEFNRIGCGDTSLKLKLVVGRATSSTYPSADPDETIALLAAAILLARETPDASAECGALGALAMYNLLPGHPSTVPEILHAMRDAAIRANDRSALWEQEQLYAVLEVHRCDFQSSLTRLEKLQAEMRDHSEGA